MDDVKTCIECHVEKPLVEFHFKNKAKGYRQPRCKPCHQADTGVRAAGRRGRINELSRARRLILKLQVLDLYGGACMCCGETNHKFLTMDHVQGDGALHRESVSQAEDRLKEMLSVRDDTRFQVLCWNCNCGRAYNAANRGICPHKGQVLTVREALGQVTEERADSIVETVKRNQFTVRWFEKEAKISG